MQGEVSKHNTPQHRDPFFFFYFLIRFYSSPSARAVNTTLVSNRTPLPSEARVQRGRQKVINATCVNSLAVADPAGDVAERGGQLLSLLGLAPLLCGGRPQPEAVRCGGGSWCCTTRSLSPRWDVQPKRFPNPAKLPQLG